MIDLSLDEARLFRALSAFFGRDAVIPHMSVLAVCGGEIPAEVRTRESAAVLAKVESWARSNRCLFTVVDGDDQPRLVVEFFSGFKEAIDVVEAEHQRFIPPLLRAARVPYVTFSVEEFLETLDPSGAVDFVRLLHAKLDECRAA